MYVVSSAKTLKLIIYQGDLKNKKLRHEALSKIVSLMCFYKNPEKVKNSSSTKAETKTIYWRKITAVKVFDCVFVASGQSLSVCVIKNK